MVALKPKIVFSDVDGTLVGADHHALEGDKPTFEHVQGMNIPVCLVSARSPEGLTQVRADLGITGAAACYSGAYIIDENGEELYSTTIGLTEALELKSFIDNNLPEVCVCTYGFHTWISDDRTDPRVAKEEYFVQAESRTCRDLREAFDDRGIHKMLLMGEPAQIEAACKTVGTIKGVVAVRSSDILCEVMAEGVSKADAVNTLCAHYGVDPKDALAFGDGDNDVEMLSACGTSYAMANATELAQKAAKRACAWKNTEHGVARTLKELCGA